MKDIIKKMYNVFRPYLPKKLGVFNGVAVEDETGILDKTNINPDYEYGIPECLREKATAGDDIVIVGGGLGVTTTVATKRVSPQGQVTVFEPSSANIQTIENTLNINKADRSCVDIKHMAVDSVTDESEEMYGNDAEDTIPAVEIPECDILELDCEGVEDNILDDMSVRPEYIIVESHGIYGTHREDVVKILSDIGYEIEQEYEQNTESGIFILLASLQ